MLEKVLCQLELMATRLEVKQLFELFSKPTMVFCRLHTEPNFRHLEESAHPHYHRLFEMTK